MCLLQEIEWSSQTSFQAPKDRNCDAQDTPPLHPRNLEPSALNSKRPLVLTRPAGRRSATLEIHPQEPTHPCSRVPEVFAPDWRLSARLVKYSTPLQAYFW